MKKPFGFAAVAVGCVALVACSQRADAVCTHMDYAEMNLREKLGLLEGVNSASAGADFWFGNKVTSFFHFPFCILLLHITAKGCPKVRKHDTQPPCSVQKETCFSF